LYFTAVPIALNCAQVGDRAAHVLRVPRPALRLVLVPWAIPTVVAARIWERIYNADYGVFNYLLGVFFQLAR
jgi:ABC-type sugar transport system permease subunit